MRSTILILALLLASPAVAQVAPPVIADPVADPAHPAGIDAFVLPVADGAMNALMYTASGVAPHPTLLLLHGFPGNEQNLDLAQAVRRAGWNVLTLHYRGSWGSPGSFSFGGAAQDAHAALAFLRTPAAIAKYRIDPHHIVVAGHSMGGFMAADAAADDPRVAGLALIDAWNIGETGRDVGTDAGMAAWKAQAAGDLPPLAGTSDMALAREMAGDTARFDLLDRVRHYGARPILIVGAARGIGAGAEAALAAAAREEGRDDVAASMMPTDHSFSDHRIALADVMVRWLGTVATARPAP